jgi:hypothetical protein
VSVGAITWALAQPVDRSSAKFVLVVLANYANADMCAWPSIAAICDATCQNRKTVMDGLRRLVSAGLIVQTGESAGRTGRVSVYQLNAKAVPETVPLEAETVPKTALLDGSEQYQKRHHSDGLMVPKTDGNGTENGRKWYRKRDTDTKGTISTQNYCAKTLAQAFDEFWSEYPRKKSKGDAERAWSTLKPSEQLQAEILSGLGRAKTSEQWTDRGGKFIPYPATWLRAKGWEDEFTPAQQQQGAPRFIAV